MHDDNFGLSGKYKEEDVKKEAIALSTSSGVVCKFTSFIAVEERSEATLGGAFLHSSEIFLFCFLFLRSLGFPLYMLYALYSLSSYSLVQTDKRAN